MATFARSPPVHQWTWSPSPSCRACLLQPMAINTYLWPLITLPNGSRPYPCDAEAHTCMRALYGAFFSRFGLPRQLHSDQGSNFESKLVAELCSISRRRSPSQLPHLLRPNFAKTCATRMRPFAARPAALRKHRKIISTNT